MIFPCMLACCARPAAGLVAPALRFSKPSVATRRSLRDAGRRVAPPTMRAPWQKFAAAPGALAPRALQGGRDPRTLGEAARRAARRALAARMLEPVISQRSDSSESISTSPRLGRSGAASAPVAASSWPRRQRDSRVLAAAAPPRPVVLSRSDRVGVVSRARDRATAEDVSATPQAWRWCRAYRFPEDVCEYAGGHAEAALDPSAAAVLVRRQRLSIPGGGVAAAPRPRRGYSVEVFRGGGVAAAPRPRRGYSVEVFHGGGSRRRPGRDADIPWRPSASVERGLASEIAPRRSTPPRRRSLRREPSNARRRSDEAATTPRRRARRR